MELISAENGISPSWSPDGKQIAFLSNRAEGWDLYVMSAAGGSPRRLTSGATVDNPAWSPDGELVAFERRRRIEAIDPASASEARDRSILVEHGGQPTWAPDGRLAFIRNGDLFLRDQSGAEQLLVRDAHSPCWSPDGRSIAFVRGGICAIDLESRAIRQRTHDRSDAEPSIALDGDIVFIRNAALQILHPDDTHSDLQHLPSPVEAPAAHPTNPDLVACQLHDGGNWDIAVVSLQHSGVNRLTRATWTSWNARL